MHLKVVLCWVAGWSLPGASAAHAACARTPAAAVGLIGKSAETAVAGDGGGFRVTSVRWDSLLGRRWALIASCGHPEWPAIEVAVSVLDTPKARQEEQLQAAGLLRLLPVVRAGDVVQLWGQEEGLRIEVGAVAEESGALGKTVRVRLMRRSTLGQQGEGQFVGVVRGPHDVEMQR